MFQNQMGYPGPGVEDEGRLQSGTGDFFWWGDAGNILSVNVVTQLYPIAKTYQDVQLKCEHFIVCILCLNESVTLP